MEEKYTLAAALEGYKNKSMVSFHTPGHKCKSKIFYEDLYNYDFTELEDTDNLYHPISCIKNTELELAKLYHTEYAIMSAMGCTSCVQSMLSLVNASGGKVISGRNLHASAVNAMALLNINPVWVNNKGSLSEMQLNKITAIDIEKAISSNNNIRAVYLTSPSYYGSILALEEINKLCKRHNIPLLIDSAHGSHLEFVNKDLSPTNLGADMVAYSWHKTLPALTGAALLCINDQKYIENAKRAMATFASTSPSYPIMLSMDLCRIWLQTFANTEFSRLLDFSSQIKQIAKKKRILLSSDLCDPLRITIKPTNIGISTDEAVSYFRSENIEVESYDKNYIVFILSAVDTEEDLNKLKLSFESLDKIKSEKICKIESEPQINNPIMAMSLNEAILSEKEVCPLKESGGRIVAECVFNCPPGVALTIPGEIITPELRELLEYYGNKTISCCAE